MLFIARIRLLTALLFLAGLLDVAASIPKTRVRDFFDTAPVLQSENRVQVADLQLEKWSLYEGTVSGRPFGFVDGPNLYTYVVQNPWTHFDPMGLDLDTDGSREGLSGAGEWVARGMMGAINAIRPLVGWAFQPAGSAEQGQAFQNTFRALSHLPGSDPSVSPKQEVAALKNTLTTPEGIGGLVGTALLGKGFSNIIEASAQGAILESRNASSTFLYRKMSAIEADESVNTQKLQPPISGTDNSKWLSESLDKVKVFDNKKVAAGAEQSIVRFDLSSDAWTPLQLNAIPQKGSKGASNVKYNEEGLIGTGKRNYGVPPTQLDNFNKAVRKVEKVTGEE